ncbi:MAG: hypothetical protein KFB95_00730 [Simkaniaceae bacterium]|nr:MAG: hypothetical protein KFB95_00730 [Simkaniaceae bacterium]
MESIQSDWAMVPTRQDQLSRQEIFGKTYGALVDRIDQDVDTKGLFNIAGNERQVEHLVKGSFDPTSFISSAEGNDYVFRDDVMATEDVHSVTIAMKRTLDYQPIISTDRLKSIYEIDFMLEGMSPEQIRCLITHGMDTVHVEALDKVLVLAGRILASGENKVTLEDLKKQLGSHLFMPLDYYSNIETSLVYRENGVKRGRPISGDEMRSGGLEINRRERINHILFTKLLGL